MWIAGLKCSLSFSSYWKLHLQILKTFPLVARNAFREIHQTTALRTLQCNDCLWMSAQFQLTIMMYNYCNMFIRNILFIYVFIYFQLLCVNDCVTCCSRDHLVFSETWSSYRCNLFIRIQLILLNVCYLALYMCVRVVYSNKIFSKWKRILFLHICHTIPQCTINTIVYLNIICSYYRLIWKLCMATTFRLDFKHNNRFYYS